MHESEARDGVRVASIDQRERLVVPRALSGWQDVTQSAPVQLGTCALRVRELTLECNLLCEHRAACLRVRSAPALQNRQHGDRQQYDQRERPEHTIRSHVNLQSTTQRARSRL